MLLQLELEVYLKGCHSIVSDSMNEVKETPAVSPELVDTDDVGDAAAIKLTRLEQLLSYSLLNMVTGKY